MADNVNVTAGTGTVIATDQVGTDHYQKIKLCDGTADSSTVVAVDIGAKANALRVAPANDITDSTYIGDIKFGESIPAGTNAIGKLAANTGVDIGDVTINNAAGGAAVNIQDGGNTITVDGTVTANLSATDNSVLDAIDTVLDTMNGKLTACNTGAVVLSSGTVTTVTTVSTVTNLSQMSGTAISMNEGTLDAGVQRVSLATDDDAVAYLATIAGDTTNIETAIQIIDDWDVTQAGAVSADGPQIMFAYDSTKPAAVADGQAARALGDQFGRMLPGVEPEREKAVYDSADASGEGETVVAAPGAGLKLYITSYIISVDAEMWVKLQDEDSNALTGKFWLKAGGGVAISLPTNTPLVLDVADKALEVITEGAGNISVSVTYYPAP